MEFSRIRLENTLQEFIRNNEIEELSLPPVFSSAERSYIHKICLNLGLISKSKGKSSNRCVVITKRSAALPFDQNSSAISKSGTLLVGGGGFQSSRGFLATLDLQNKTMQLFQNSNWMISLADADLRTDPYDLKKSCVTENTNACRVHDRLSLPPPQVPFFPTNNDMRQRLMRDRVVLPIMSHRSRILKMIENNQVSLIIGETGSGKSTQVPQFLLEEGAEMRRKCRIIVTEPRRIAAITVAERCANERGENLGGTVGYQIRLERDISPKTLLTFCTNGILLRTLIGAQITLMNISHIIIDEVHERDRMSDFLLTVLREILPEYSHLRLILMSASLDTEKFINYFPNSAVLEVPGRLYDVKEHFLEDVLELTNYRLNRGFQRYGGQKDESSFEVEFENGDCVEPRMSVFNNSVVPNLPKGPVTNIDELLENTWLTGGLFELDYLCNQIAVGNVPLNCCHSKSGLSPISIVAGRGAMDQLKKLARLGATQDENQLEDAKIMAYRCGHSDAIDFLNNYKPESAEEDNDVSNEFAQGDSNSMYPDFTVPNPNPWRTSSDAPKTNGALPFGPNHGNNKRLNEYFGDSSDDDQIDITLIIELVNFILNSSQYGAILVFLPGYEDLMQTRDQILMDARLMKSNLTICILHSQMMPNDQREAFLPTPEGSRKIVLSTNIAEVSVTINDVVHVIDSGKMKERIFDSCSGVSMLSHVWISKANALQRKGRAGRCSYGYCYRLYSRLRYQYMPDNPVPEMLRVPIHELCLQTKLLFPDSQGVQSLLTKAPDSPSPGILSSSIQLLKSIGAMTEEENLTLLGRKLVELPADPQFAKMLLFGVLLKCIDPILTIVACLSYKDPFILPKVKDEKRAATEARGSFSAEMYSDHLVYLRAYEGWYSAYMQSYERQYCSQNFLSSSSMNMIYGIRNQFRYQLFRLGYLGSSDNDACYATYNTNRNNWPIIKAALVAGSYPCLSFVDKERRKIRTKRENVEISMYSTLLKGKRYSASRQCELLPTEWLVYNELVRIRRHVQIKCATAVTPVTVCLFSGPTHLTASEALKTVRQHSVFETWEDRSPSEFGVMINDVIEIDELVFKTELQQSKRVIQLREKIFSLFFRMLRVPWNCNDDSTQDVLNLLSDVLKSEDEHFNLAPKKSLVFVGGGESSAQKFENSGQNSQNSAGFSNDNSAKGRNYRQKSYFHNGGRQKKY